MSGASINLEICAAGSVPHHSHASPHACLVVRGTMHDRAWPARREAACVGDLLINPSGAEHAIEAGEEGLTCIVVEWHANVEIDSFRRAKMDYLSHETQRLVESSRATNPATRKISAAELVAKIESAIGRHDDTGSPDWLVETVACLRAAERNFSVGDLAAWAGVHRATLSRRFRDGYGLSPERYSLLLRLERAADLLMSGESLASAALASGFYDQSHLNRAWRRYLGATPRRWLHTTIVQESQNREAL